MPSNSPTIPSVFRGIVAAAIAVAFSAVSTSPTKGQDAPDSLEALREIPDRFFQAQDSAGYFWQAAGNGALTSGETQYLQSGLNLLVDGTAFAPNEAKAVGPSGEVGDEGVEGMVLLSEKREGLSLQRSLKFELVRGAVRFFDTIENLSGSERKVEVVLRTTYPFAWQTLHGADGALLSSDPVLRLAEDETGVVVRFGAADGRPDTLILIGDGAAVEPDLSASSNRRELTLRYRLTIGAGKKASLLHWIAMRALSEPEDASGEFAGFLQGGKLVRPEVDPSDVSTIANFSATSFPDKAAAAANLRSLVALNLLLDRTGMNRRSRDLLWLGPASQFEGTIDPEARLVVRTALAGEQEVTAERIAAIRGGAGTGRHPRVYLRDGRVFSGPVVAENFRLLIEGGDPVDLDTAAFPLFLGRIDPSDGAIPEGTVGFLETIDQTVVAIGSGEGDFPGTTVWSSTGLSPSRIREMASVSRPMPGHRARLDDGSAFPLFLSPDRFPLPLAGGGTIEVGGNEVIRFWNAGTDALAIESIDERWLELEEIPFQAPTSALFLLDGNTLLTGEFDPTPVRFRSDAVEISLDPARIASVVRIDDEVRANSRFPQRLRVVLKSGESIEGVPVDPFFAITRDGETQEHPWTRFLAFRADSDS